MDEGGRGKLGKKCKVDEGEFTVGTTKSGMEVDTAARRRSLSRMLFVDR